MAFFRFLHLSDLHLSAQPGRLGPLALLKPLRIPLKLHQFGLLASHDPFILNELDNLIAYLGRSGLLNGIIVTGDLATSGGAGDQSFSATKIFTWDRCARVAILPGNHDRYRPPFCTPGNLQFDISHLPLWTVGQGAQSSIVTVDGGSVAVVAGDFSLPASVKNPARFLGRGRVNARTLDAMIQLTQEARAIPSVSHRRALEQGRAHPGRPHPLSQVRRSNVLSGNADGGNRNRIRLARRQHRDVDRNRSDDSQHAQGHTATLDLEQDGQALDVGLRTIHLSALGLKQGFDD
jgi:3',5'-cyclic AMP phosphodiesterase CpdA